jgi:hypothetical protein
MDGGRASRKAGVLDQATMQPEHDSMKQLRMQTAKQVTTLSNFNVADLDTDSGLP